MKTLLGILLLTTINALSQSQVGVVLNAKDRSPVPYAKIAVVGKGIGTIADENGNFALVIDKKYQKDMVGFACIGYVPYRISVADYGHMPNKTILLQEKTVAPVPVKQVPANAKAKTYGVAGTSDMLEIHGGLPGSEVGLVFNFKDSARLDKLTLNVESCTLDTIFYRVNVYNVVGTEFHNMLTKPIYYKIPSGELQNNTISIDLTAENVWVKGSKLITIEQVRNYGNGMVRYNGTKNGKSFARKSAFAVWRVIPTTISMLVQATSVK